MADYGPPPPLHLHPMSLLRGRSRGLRHHTLLIPPGTWTLTPRIT
jgi:hypothetical protein